MSLHRFYLDSMIRARKQGERYGQALFNHLSELRPDIAEQVRGSSIDPFYLKGPADNEVKWDGFISLVEKEWFKGV